jgi:hypothetical protein
MSVPVILARLKERNNGPALGIKSLRLHPLKPVTARTSQTEIAFFCPATGSYGQDVFNLEWHAENELLGLAVLTAMPGTFGDMSTKSGWDVGHDTTA